MTITGGAIMTMTTTGGAIMTMTMTITGGTIIIITGVTKFGSVQMAILSLYIGIAITGKTAQMALMRLIAQILIIGGSSTIRQRTVLIAETTCLSLNVQHVRRLSLLLKAVEESATGQRSLLPV